SVIPELPRLPNGKLDRARLAAITLAQDSRERVTVEPRNGVEAKLLAMLKEVLALEDASIDDDFFAIGGTSLLGMRYLARVTEALHVELGASALLRAPTVERLAELIDRGGAETASAELPGLPELPSLWRPLPLARAEGTFASIDAAAIAYLPHEVVSL